MKIEILRNSDENVDKIISKQQDEALYIYICYIAVFTTTYQ